MCNQPKRLKKNISFSEHDKDIYDYLNSVKNASALIKRLVYNHMILEQGLVVPAVATLETNKQVQEQETDTKPYKTENTEEVEPLQEPEVYEDELEEKIEELEEDELEEYIDEQAITVNEELEQSEEEPLVPIDFTDEDLKNKEILPDL